MINTEPKEGFKNRNTDPLPEEPTIMTIVVKDVDGENQVLCKWHPAEQNNRGFLGTANELRENGKGIGYHAWEANNSEFIYYSIPKIYL